MNMRRHKRQRVALTIQACRARQLSRFAAGLQGLAAGAQRAAQAMKRFQSAVTVFGMEVREHAEAKYPQHFRRQTRAGEMADAAVARARKL